VPVPLVMPAALLSSRPPARRWTAGGSATPPTPSTWPRPCTRSAGRAGTRWSAGWPTRPWSCSGSRSTPAAW